MPQVFTGVQWLSSIDHFILFMLKHQHLIVVVKGVHLLNGVLVKSQTGSIGAQALMWNDCRGLLEVLLHVMTSSQEKSVTQMAAKAFGFLFTKFDHTFKYNALSYVFHKSNHSGILGYAVTLFKDEINSSLKYPANEQPAEFTGKKILKLLKVLFTLPDDEKTNLLDRTEYILGVLNLLRYLVLRDKPTTNATCIWTLMPEIEGIYLENLRRAITLSRAHYELDVEKVKKGKKMTAEESAEVELTVSGQSMPGMTREQKLHVLQTALHTFDMMESIIGRVVELMDQAKKS